MLFVYCCCYGLRILLLLLFCCCVVFSKLFMLLLLLVILPELLLLMFLGISIELFERIGAFADILLLLFLLLVKNGIVRRYAILFAFLAKMQLLFFSKSSLISWECTFSLFSSLKSHSN